MELENLHVDLPLLLDGIGIVFYSDGAAASIPEGSDYFQAAYSAPAQVAAHLNRGDIVGFCTGSGGDFTLKFRYGVPPEELLGRYPVRAQLAIDVRGERICVRDLYDLMDWRADCPESQQVAVPAGVYGITLCTAKPASGIWGDGQVIYVYLDPVSKMPELDWTGVPQLFR